ncbi:MAG: site-specific integrase [Synechococcus sp.]
MASTGIALRLEARGQRLGLRGPLPRRDGEGLKVQRLSLGLPFDAAGLEQAERQLRQVVQDLQHQRFRWEAWGRGPAAAPAGGQERSSSRERGNGAAAAAASPEAPEAFLADFEAAFFADPRRRRNPAGSRTTWSSAYRPYLRRLASTAGERTLSAALLEEVLESYAPGSRSRQQCGTALAALARHRRIPLPDDWAERAAGYGLHAARFRHLPSDSLILEAVAAMPNPGWRLAYGLMATYGLRNHEVFFCDLSALAPGGDRVLRVLPTSKTGEHQVWPFQPHWVEHFGLEQLGRDPQALPPVCTDLRRTTLQQVGRRVAEQFRRYDLPLTPYDLRHAWAVRTIHIGLPDTVAARMMGHSVAIHTRTYHHWITRRDQQQAVDTALARQASLRRAA